MSARATSALLLLLVALPAGAEAVRWPMARERAEGGGHAQLSLGQSHTLRSWRFQARSHVWGYRPGLTVWSSVALTQLAGRPLVLAGSYDNNVYCLDGITGKARWRFTTGGGVYRAPAIWSGGGIESTVYVASADRLVYALDLANGRRRWIHTVKAWRPTIGGARLTAPALGKVAGAARLFFGHWVWDKSLGGHLQAAGLTGLDAKDGKKHFTLMLGDSPLSDPVFAAVQPGSPRVFIASEDGNLHAIDAKSGRAIWRHTARAPYKASPTFFQSSAGPRVVIGSRRGLIRCFDARDGRLVWQYKTHHWVDGGAAVAAVDGRPVVFVGSYDHGLYALDGGSGALRWRYQAAGGVYSSPALVKQGSETLVIVAAWDHHLHCLSARDGKLRWSTYTGRPLWDSLPLGESVWASPATATIDGKTMLYFGAYSGPLHAFPLAEAERSALAKPGSNLRFFLTMPLVLAFVSLLAIGLTRRERARKAAQPSKSSASAESPK